MPRVLVHLSCVNRDYCVPCSNAGFDLLRVCGHCQATSTELQVICHPVWKGVTLPQHLVAPLVIHCLFSPADRNLRLTMGPGIYSLVWRCGNTVGLWSLDGLIVHHPSPKILPIFLAHRTDSCFQFVGRFSARLSKLPV